jgi:2-oxoglutarate ferredoxin oxidoreductase subunit delta
MGTTHALRRHSTGRHQHLVVHEEWCKGCGICVEFCPQQVLALDDRGKVRVAHPERCRLCRQCELRCPDFALELSEEDPGENDRAGNGGVS